MSTLTFKHLYVIAEAPDKEEEIEKVLYDIKAKAVSKDYEYDAVANETRYTMTISMRGKVDIRNLFQRLSSIEGIKRVSLKKG